MNCNFQLCVLELFHLKSTVKENKEHTHESLNLPVSRTPRLSNNKKVRVLKAHFPRDKFDLNHMFHTMQPGLILKGSLR